MQLIMSKSKDKPGWLYRLLTGSFGYNGVNFFETLKLAQRNKVIIKELNDYFKKHNLL